MVDIPATRRGARAIAVQATGVRPAFPAFTIAWSLPWVIACAGMMTALLAPAIWNGFPLIFPDTGGYFTAPMLYAIANGRSALYGFFLDLGIPFAFWPCVVAQAAMMVWLFMIALRVNGLGGRPWLALGIVAMLSAVTSLPWFAGQLMPDIFFPAAVLSLYLLAFAHEQLSRAERWGGAAIIAFSIASHMALAGLCVGIVIALFILMRVARRITLPALPKLRLKFAAASVAAGIALCPISNLVLTGSFAFTPGGTTFLFGRLIEDGIIARYLEDQCPDSTIRLCAYQSKLPALADDWLWGNSPLYELGGWEGYEPEEKRIINATLLRYPLVHITSAVKATLAQFASFATEISLDDNEPTFNSFREFIPQFLPALMSARQQAERFDVAPLNWLYVPVAGFAVAGLVLALAFRRRLRVAPQPAALCLIILLALAGNAAICGVFSHPVDRYQSRLVLLAPFAVAILLARRWSAAQPRVNPPS
ncbi:MAG TPA: hypothetical protein VFC54_14895 [Pseudolabrys sp.]|nr:hypothetical protein [Pseudolabrys sp.]